VTEEHDYIDEEGFYVEVKPWGHITHVSENHAIHSKGRRFIPARNGNAPSVISGTHYASGAYKFMSHSAPEDQARVVEDLGCEEGRALWKDYVVLPDGTQGPTVESVASPGKMREYMRLTGHRERDRGESNPLDKIRERAQAASRKLGDLTNKEV